MVVAVTPTGHVVVATDDRRPNATSSAETGRRLERRRPFPRDRGASDEPLFSSSDSAETRSLTAFVSSSRRRPPPRTVHEKASVPRRRRSRLSSQLPPRLPSPRRLLRRRFLSAAHPSWTWPRHATSLSVGRPSDRQSAGDVLGGHFLDTVRPGVTLKDPPMMLLNSSENRRTPERRWSGLQRGGA